ncbi:hypothetical protein EVAR_84382_1 [Eumeta japonica]|uniref:Uncharacterized protein n=1 Tax=Eumeta variegata TaxID=151549 RepID=A0A4C1U4D5_EUMVA|nr:hypothetical protein EVAR_84382_1 [Eumeta japonica]
MQCADKHRRYEHICVDCLRYSVSPVFARKLGSLYLAAVSAEVPVDVSHSPPSVPERIAKRSNVFSVCYLGDIESACEHLAHPPRAYAGRARRRRK